MEIKTKKRRPIEIFSFTFYSEVLSLGYWSCFVVIVGNNAIKIDCGICGDEYQSN